MRTIKIALTFSTLLIILTLLTFPTWVFADFDSTKWIYTKEIRVPTTNQSKLASFTLDNEVFGNSQGNLADLRIIASDGRETAYKLTVETSQKTSQPFPVAISNLGSLFGQYTQLVLDLNKEGITHNLVTLQTQSVNFRRQVEVESSRDGQSWLVVKKATEGGYIYDYSLDFKAKNTTVGYPESTYRYLRLKIMDNGEEPIKVGGAAIFYNVLTSARAVGYKPKAADRGEDKQKQTSFYILDLESRGLPSNQIAFTTKDANFNREVAIEGSNDKNNWTPVGSRDVIFGYDTPKFVGSKLTLVYPEVNYRYLRLTVFNRDNQPITLSDFKVLGTLRKVLFQASPGQTYNLYYGNSKARFAEYDLESYLRYLDTGDTLAAVLGVEEKNSAFVGEIPPEKPLTERYPYLLPGVLGVLVLILGSMVVKLATQVKRGK